LPSHDELTFGCKDEISFNEFKHNVTAVYINFLYKKTLPNINKFVENVINYIKFNVIQLIKLETYKFNVIYLYCNLNERKLPIQCSINSSESYKLYCYQIIQHIANFNIGSIANGSREVRNNNQSTSDEEDVTPKSILSLVDQYKKNNKVDIYDYVNGLHSISSTKYRDRYSIDTNSKTFSINLCKYDNNYNFKFDRCSNFDQPVGYK
jgi:hypothetical protein